MIARSTRSAPVAVTLLGCALCLIVVACTSSGTESDELVAALTPAAAEAAEVAVATAIPTAETPPAPSTVQPTAAAETGPADDPEPPAMTAVIHIAGRINFDTGELELRPTRALPTTKPVEQDDGPYTVELIDTEGAVLDSQRFDSDVIEDTEGDFADFSAVLPRPSQPISIIRVSQDGIELATATSDGSVPTIAISQPGPASEVSLAQATFEWQGESSTERTLYYTVLVSFDAGESYTSLLSSSEDTKLDVSARLLQPTDQATLLVSVSDGVNTAFVQSELFSIN